MWSNESRQTVTTRISSPLAVSPLTGPLCIHHVAMSGIRGEVWSSSEPSDMAGCERVWDWERRCRTQGVPEGLTSLYLCNTGRNTSQTLRRQVSLTKTLLEASASQTSNQTSNKFNCVDSSQGLARTTRTSSLLLLGSLQSVALKREVYGTPLCLDQLQFSVSFYEWF